MSQPVRIELSHNSLLTQRTYHYTTYATTEKNYIFGPIVERLMKIEFTS